VKRTLKPVAYWMLVASALALGTWLRAPALRGGLLSDDWDHYAMCAGIYPNVRRAWDLFNFVSNDAVERRELLSSGRLPWWSDPDIQIGFLRPLSSLFVWIDHAVLDVRDAPVRAHVHSLLWWLLGALGVAAVFRRILPPSAAGLAVLLYAVDDAHALPVAWSASRAELIAVAAMSWALWAQLEWRHRGFARHRWLSLALVWLGLFSGEHAIALLALMVAAELADVARPLAARARALLPLALPLAVYLIARAALHYGVAGSSFYMDPLDEPLRFLRAFGLHVPLLAADLGLGYAADYWYGEPPWWLGLPLVQRLPAAWLAPSVLQRLAWSCGVGVLVASVLFWIWLGRRAEDASARSLRWLIAGALAALVPLASAIPMTRLTVVPALAFHATYAWFAVGAWQVLRGPAPWFSRLAAGALCALLLASDGVQPAIRGRSLSEYYARMARVELRWALRAQFDDATLPARHVIVLSAFDVATRFSLPFVRHFAGRSMPASSEVLLPPFLGTLQLRRPSADTLELEAATGFSDLRHSAYRREDRDFHAGERWPGERFSVEVLATDHGVPRHLRFVFAHPLEDARYLFLYPTAEGLRTFSLPPVGATRPLPQPALPNQDEP
jgi:hypothetical protein